MTMLGFSSRVLSKFGPSLKKSLHGRDMLFAAFGNMDGLGPSLLFDNRHKLCLFKIKLTALSR